MVVALEEIVICSLCMQIIYCDGIMVYELCVPLKKLTIAGIVLVSFRRDMITYGVVRLHSL